MLICKDESIKGRVSRLNAVTHSTISNDKMILSDLIESRSNYEEKLRQTTEIVSVKAEMPRIN